MNSPMVVGFRVPRGLVKGALLKEASFEAVEMEPESPLQQLGFRAAKIQSDVEHIQRDVTEIKEDVRRVNKRIDDLSPVLRSIEARVEQVNLDSVKEIGNLRTVLIEYTNQKFEDARKHADTKFEELRKHTDGRFKEVRDHTDSKFEEARKHTDSKFEEARRYTDAKFDDVRKELSHVKDSIASAKVWALLLYFGLAGTLLFVMARGFKWL